MIQKLERAAWIVAIAMTFVGVFWLFCSGIDDHPCMSVHDTIQGEGCRPSSERVLLPVATRLVLTLAHPSGAPEKTYWRLNPELDSYLDALRLPNQYPYDFLALGLVLALAFLGFVLSLRALFRDSYYASTRATDLMTLLALLALQSMFGENRVWDVGVLFVNTLALVYMRRRQWLQYGIVFALACLNKETALLLTLMFSLHYWKRLDRNLFLKIFGTQALVFAATRTIIQLNHLNARIEELRGGLWAYNINLLRAYQPAGFVIEMAVFLLILARWREKPEFARSGLWMLLPLVVGTLMWGQLDELRAYLEVYPILVLLAASPIAAAMGTPLRARSE